jgi:hypothetical protein
LILVLLVVAGVFAVRDLEVRRRLRPWAALFGAALVVALAGTLIFQTANDLYRAQVGSLFNRIVLPASIAYVCMFVALLGIVYELARRFTSRAWAGVAIVAVLALGSGWHQLRISTTHKEHWEASWDEQQVALPGYAAAVRGLPADSRLVGFGVPNWEPEFIPIFAAPWDLRGAIAYTTHVSPPTATPMSTLISCGPQGLLEAEVETFPYKVPGQPLYFIDAPTRKAIRVDSQAACERGIEAFGTPPIFAGEPGIPGDLSR